MTEDVITVVIDVEDTKRRLAYDLWEKAGGPEGQSDVYWLEACRIVEAEMSEPDWLKRYAAEAKAEAEVATTKRARRAA